MSQCFFDLGEEYDDMLNQGLRLSGEDKSFFIRGRIREIRRRLGVDWRPRRVLDFGCGTGDAARHLAKSFPEAEVVGIDAAAGALSRARRAHASSRIRFLAPDALADLPPFELAYVNGVFHHIAPPDRPEVVRELHRALTPGGYLALFENNPWNPGTRMVMHRIPFDRDASMLSAPLCRRLVRGGGFTGPTLTRFLFYFPRPLAWLRIAEPRLARIPFGAQYLVLAKK